MQLATIIYRELCKSLGLETYFDSMEDSTIEIQVVWTYSSCNSVDKAQDESCVATHGEALRDHDPKLKDVFRMLERFLEMKTNVNGVEVLDLQPRTKAAIQTRIHQRA